MNKEVLDLLGKQLINEVRDGAIASVEHSLQDFKDPSHAWMQAISQLDSNTQNFLRRLLRWQTDQVIAHVLSLLENSKSLRLEAYRDGLWTDVVAVSDGLAGELFSKRGWIAKFSRYPSDFSS